MLFIILYTFKMTMNAKLSAVHIQYNVSKVVFLPPYPLAVLITMYLLPPNLFESHSRDREYINTIIDIDGIFPLLKSSFYFPIVLVEITSPSHLHPLNELTSLYISPLFVSIPILIHIAFHSIERVINWIYWNRSTRSRLGNGIGISENRFSYNSTRKSNCISIKWFTSDWSVLPHLSISSSLPTCRLSLN